MPHFRGNASRGSRNSLHNDISNECNSEIRYEKKVHLGGQAKPSLYSAKNPVKDHNPDKILPPQYYIFGDGCLVAKGAGVYFQSSTYECGFNKFL